MAVEWEQAYEDPRGHRRRSRSPVKDDALRLETREVLTTHEDGVAWLAVLGAGTWGYGHDTGEREVDRFGVEKPVVVMRNFPAGLHWVDQETVDFARRARVPFLMVTDEAPQVVRRELPGPLGPEHLQLPADGALVPASLPEPPSSVSAEEPGVAPLDFPCGYCDRRLPSAAVRALHVEEEHERDVRAELEAEPEPEPVEHALTDA